MSEPTLSEQLAQIKEAAMKRGLRVRRDRRLHRTSYRAMNPRAARELHQPYIPKTLTYTLSNRRPKHRLVMDLRHELVEYVMMGRGHRYKVAHRVANREQLDKTPEFEL